MVYAFMFLWYMLLCSYGICFYVLMVYAGKLPSSIYNNTALKATMDRICVFCVMLNEKSISKNM
jgi:hypothetical protein